MTRTGHENDSTRAGNGQYWRGEKKPRDVRRCCCRGIGTASADDGARRNYAAQASQTARINISRRRAAFPNAAAAARRSHPPTDRPGTSDEPTVLCWRRRRGGGYGSAVDESFVLSRSRCRWLELVFRLRRQDYRLSSAETLRVHSDMYVARPEFPSGVCC